MEAMFNFIPAPIALVLMFIGFAALAVGAIRLGYKQYVKQWALELVTIAEDSIMGSGQGAKKKAQVFAALRGALPDWLKPFITDEVLDSVIEKAVSMMKKALADKKPTINKSVSTASSLSRNRGHGSSIKIIQNTRKEYKNVSFFRFCGSDHACSARKHQRRQRLWLWQ